MTLRLEQLGLIPSGSLRLLKDANFEPKKAESLLELPSHPIDDTKVPQRFIYLAIQAFEQEKISQGRLARLLRCHPVEARRIVQECLIVEIEDEEGGPTVSDSTFRGPCCLRPLEDRGVVATDAGCNR